MKREYVNWLSKYKWNAFATITLKQAIHYFDKNGNYRLKHITEADIQTTAEFFVKRLNKRILSSKAKMGEKLPVLSFKEGDGLMKRYHLHFIYMIPNLVNQERFKAKFYQTFSDIVFGYNECNVQFIDDSDAENIVRYCFKCGEEAFLPTASYLNKF